MIRAAVRNAILASATTTLVLSGTATAADEALDTVVIVGIAPLPGAEQDINAIAAPVQTAGAEEIEASHALDLSAYMNRSLGSVYVNEVQNNPLQPDLNYRGYAASPLLGTPQGLSVYLDGVRLNQPFGDVVSWDLIPRQAIETLTLIPGSNPVFGLNTLGGALALRTKDGFSSPGVSLGVNYGSHKRRSIEAEAGGHSDSGLYWYGTANKLKEDGWRDASPTDATQLFGTLGYRNDSSDISLTAAHADTDLTGNGFQDERLLFNDYSSVYTKPDNTRNRSSLFNVVATHRVSESLQLSANAFHRSIRTRTLNGDINDDSLGENLYQPNLAERNALTAAGYTGFPTSGETQANQPFPSWRCIANVLLNTEPNEKCNGLYNRTATRQHDGGVNMQATFGSSLWQRENHLTIGAGWVHTGSKFTQSSQFGYLSPDRGIVTVEGPGAFADGTQDSENAFDARVDLHGNTNTTSLYISDTLQLTPTAALTLSGRYDHTKLESDDQLTPAGPGSLTGNHKFSRFNPAVGFTFNPADGLSAYLGYSEGSRAPSVIELGCADPENPCKLPNSMAGDPPLDQVKTRTVEAGLRNQPGTAVKWNVGIFRADNRDDIMFVADDQSGFGYFRNFGKTRRQGAEAGASTRIGPVTLGANLSLLKATYRSEEEVGGEGNSSNEEGAGFEGTIDVEPGNRIPLTPRHIVKLMLDWDILDDVTLSADSVTVGGSYVRGNENNEHEADGVYYLGRGRTGGYTVVNLGVEYRPLPELKLFAQANNVLDRRYFTGGQLGSTGFNAAGAFVARPFAGPIVDGERPMLGTTFLAPGAPRAYWVGLRYTLSGRTE